MFQPFGFAPPIQHRLPMATGPDSAPPMQPMQSQQPQGGSLSRDIGDVKSAMQQLGLGPAPPPSAGPISVPMIPTGGPGIGDATSAVANGTADAMSAGFPDAAAAAGDEAAMAGTGDAAAASSAPDIGEMLAELFI